MRMTARNRTGPSKGHLSVLKSASFASMAILLAGVASSARAEESADVALGVLRACAQERDDALRLACYDRGAARAGFENPAVSGKRAGPTAAAAKFGYRGAVARAELESEAAEDSGAQRIEATIVELSTRPRGELVLTLDNEQVWTQKSAERVHLKVGDRVAIKKASLGSFLLIAPSKKTTRVVRER